MLNFAAFLVYFVVLIVVFADGISTNEISPDIPRPETFDLSINSSYNNYILISFISALNTVQIFIKGVTMFTPMENELLKFTHHSYSA